MAKLKGLGKGLDALLPGGSLSNIAEVTDDTVLQQIELSKLKPGKFQPRKNFNQEELEELAQSIKAHGILQPIVVREVGNNYEIIAGERRYRAAKLAGLDTVPAIIRKLSDQETLAIALIENIQRKDLNVIEEARGFKRLVDEFKLTHENLAKVAAKSRSHITNILRLLNLHEDIQDLLLDNEITMGHARALITLPFEQQLDLAREIIDNDLTTAMVEKRVAELLDNNKSEKEPNSRKLTTIDPDIQNLANNLADKLGMNVKIRHSNNGSGKVTLNYASIDELDKLLTILN